MCPDTGVTYVPGPDRLGVLPVEMRFDPDAAEKPLFGYHDLLYIAGGRDGLWAMQGDADDKNAPNRAVRLDDAGTIGGDQDSRRWCNDLAFVTLGSPGDETTYLLALFGAKNESHLRMYLLEDALAAANSGFNNLEEFGYEITEEYRFSMRRWKDPLDGYKKKIRYRLAKLFSGTDVTDPNTAYPPRELKEIFFTATEDQFLSRGYYQYLGAGYCPEYNEDRDVDYLFASLLDTPQGIRVLDFQLLIDAIDDDGETSDGTNYLLSDEDDWGDATVGELTTHPEFWTVDDCREDGYDSDALDLLGRLGEFGGRVRTLPPQFIELPRRGEGFPADTWVLVVPCGYAAAHEEAEVFDNHSGWMPQPQFLAGYSHLMVRFFDIQDPSKISEHNPLNPGQFGSPELPAYTLLGPDEGSAAMFLRTLHLDLDGLDDDRYFCFVADLGGHLYVYDITNLLTIPPDFSQDGIPPNGIKSHIHYGAVVEPHEVPLFATYVPPDCPADDVTSNIWDVEVDQTSWTDDQSEVHHEVYVYVSVQREGVQVLRLDVDGNSDETRLVPVKMISTPGETSFLYLCDVPTALEAADYHGTTASSYVTDRLLFVGDAIAGFRIYTYGFEAQ